MLRLVGYHSLHMKKATHFSSILFVLLQFFLLAATTQHACAEVVVVDSMHDLREAIKKASPGTVIEIVDGNYDLKKSLELKRLKGTASLPVTIRAQNDLKVVLTGAHPVKIRDSEHLALSGFRFAMKSDAQGKNGAVSVRNCQHCQITGNELKLDEQDTKNGNQTWLTLYGPKSAHNRIDHNHFSGKTREGHYIFVTGEDDYVSQHDVIEFNHFEDLAWGNDENGYETIRVGESRIGNAGGKSFTTIRENLFERCQGEDEIVSFKVGGCSFVDNTVVNCHGSIVFRDGSDGIFSGNMILNTYDKPPFEDYRAGGARFYGSGHRVFNNYFEGLDGTSMKAPLALMHGASAGSGALGVADGLPATNCKVVHNTWVNCAQLRLGHSSTKRPLKPTNCTFAYNIVWETEDERLLQFFEADSITCSGNIVFPSRSKDTGLEGLDFPEHAFRIVDPAMDRSDGIFRVTAKSPAVNAVSQGVAFATSDMDGQQRDERPDVGADEYVEGSEKVRQPFTAGDVGPAGRSETARKAS